MSRYQYNSLFYGVALTHDEAKAIYNDSDFTKFCENPHYLELKTHSNNFYEDISLDYCDDPEVPHFLGVEFEQNTTTVSTVAEISYIIDIFNKDAPQFLKKHNINIEPKIHRISYTI